MKPLAPLFTWLKEAFKNLLSVLKGIVLIIVAVVLLAFAIPCGGIFYLCTIWSKKQEAREIMTNSGRFFYLVSLSFDHLGNVVCPGLFSWLFLESLNTPFVFGVPGQSISQVLGWNYLLGNLSGTGLFLRRILNVFETEHCERAVAKTLEDARAYLEKAREVQDIIEANDRKKAFELKYS